MIRLTHAHLGGLAVFRIGMTVNHPWRPDQWLPVVRQMPLMLAELHRNRAAHERGEEAWWGFLGHDMLLGGRGPVVVQWWRDVEDIYAYASLAGGTHRQAWTEFNRRARAAGDAVGIWHETYRVGEGGHESIYVGLAKPLGLAAATGAVEAERRGRGARDRLRSTSLAETGA